MAEAPITDTIGNVGSTALSIGTMIIVLILILGFIIALYFIYKNIIRYKQFKVVIWSKDAFGQTKEEYDEAGIFVDKQTRNKRLFLRRNNVGLEPDKIPYVTTKGGKKTIYLLRTGLKNFRYIKPKLDLNDELSFNVGEEDVNWAVNAYERAKKTFTQSIIMQYLPFIILAFVSIITLILIMALFNKFDVLRDVAVALKEAAQATSGTTVLPA